MANVLTVLRLLLVPVFIYVLATSPDGTSTTAAILFAAASITDYFDGYYARRTGTTTEFGRVADPLADRLLVGSALIIMLVRQTVPVAGLMIVLFRDALMMAGYYVLSRRNIKMTVSVLGKVSSAVLMIALVLILAGADAGIWVFWVGVVLSVVSGVQYAVRAVRQLRQPRFGGDALKATAEGRRVQ